jgi:hypothetical protein
MGEAERLGIDFFYESNFRKEVQRARMFDSRILLIKNVLLSEASRLAVSHGSGEVSMDNPYRTIEEYIGQLEYFADLNYAIDRAERRDEALRRRRYGLDGNVPTGP